MANFIKQCRVCGKSYETCRSLSMTASKTFRWQDVACSPECGAIYLEQVLASRGELPSKNEVSEVVEENVDSKTVSEISSDDAPVDNTSNSNTSVDELESVAKSIRRKAKHK